MNTHGNILFEKLHTLHLSINKIFQKPFIPNLSGLLINSASSNNCISYKKKYLPKWHDAVSKIVDVIFCQMRLMFKFW